MKYKNLKYIKNMDICKDVLKIIISKCDLKSQIHCLAVNRKWNSCVVLSAKAISWENFEDEPFSYLSDFANDKTFINWVMNEIPSVDMEDLRDICKKSKYLRQNIKEIYYYKNGVNDEEEWRLLGKMKNEKYFYMCAACDYTGFDCQGSIEFTFSDTLLNILKFGMCNSSRKDFYHSI